MGWQPPLGASLWQAVILRWRLKDAQFCTPGVHIGLFLFDPNGGFVAQSGDKTCYGNAFDGEYDVRITRAAELGLVNQVVRSAELREASMVMAKKIASKSSLTVATGKRAFYQSKRNGFGGGLQRTMLLNIMAENMLAHDAEEGIAAFIEKRAPDWRDE